MDRWAEAVDLVDRVAEDVNSCCEYDADLGPTTAAKMLYKAVDLLEIGPGQIIED